MKNQLKAMLDAGERPVGMFHELQSSSAVECIKYGGMDYVIIDAICALDGIDGIFVGPYDLSTGMGHPGEFDRPEFQQALADILAACQRHGKYAFIYAGNVAAARADFALGYQSVTYGMDAIALIEAVTKIVTEIRE